MGIDNIGLEIAGRLNQERVKVKLGVKPAAQVTTRTNADDLVKRAAELRAKQKTGGAAAILSPEALAQKRRERKAA